VSARGRETPVRWTVTASLARSWRAPRVRLTTGLSFAAALWWR
jgi:hypothetical protein